jgi:hypothetical protein
MCVSPFIPRRNSLLEQRKVGFICHAAPPSVLTVQLSSCRLFSSRLPVYEHRRTPI